MIRCFDILIGCKSASIRIRLHPDPDPVKIWIWPDPTVMDPVGSRSGRILKYGIRCTPNINQHQTKYLMWHYCSTNRWCMCWMKSVPVWTGLVQWQKLVNWCNCLAGSSTSVLKRYIPATKLLTSAGLLIFTKCLVVCHWWLLYLIYFFSFGYKLCNLYCR